MADEVKIVKIGLADYTTLKTTGSVEIEGKIYTYDESNVYSISDTSEKIQEKLVSGTTIKTINEISVLGSGNIKIDAGATGPQGPQGPAGDNGYNSATIYLYKKSTSSTSKPNVPSEDLTYTFATKTLSGELEGWTTNLSEAKTSNNDIIYVTAACASSISATDTITSGDWSDPVIYNKDGLNTAELSLYCRSNITPEVPSENLTYNFATCELTPTTGYTGWTFMKIPDGTAPCYITKAMACNGDNEDTIESDDWSDPVVFVKDGTPGEKGADGTSVNIKGTVANWTALQDVTGMTKGDGYIVENASDDPGKPKETEGILYTYDGSSWIYCGQIKGPKGDSVVESYNVTGRNDSYWSNLCAETAVHDWDALLQGGTTTCRQFDYFSVWGTATDTENTYILYYRQTVTDNKQLRGALSSYLKATKGVDGENGDNGDSVISKTAYYKTKDITIIPDFITTEPGTEEKDNTWYKSSTAPVLGNYAAIYFSINYGIKNGKTGDETWGKWTAPAIFLCKYSNFGVNVLQTANGLFGYGQGIYYTCVQTFQYDKQYDPGDKIDQSVAIEIVATCVDEKVYDPTNNPTGKYFKTEDWISTIFEYYYYDSTNTKFEKLTDVDTKEKYNQYIQQYTNLYIIASQLFTLYINATYIKTGAITVYNSTASDHKVLFEAGLSDNKVTIGGFEVNEKSLHTKDYISSFDEEASGSGVYVGTDGIKLGENFSVDASGKVTASDLTLTGYATTKYVDDKATTTIESAKTYTDTEVSSERTRAIAAETSAQTIANGKSTNYYSDDDPSEGGTYTMKAGDCWFDTGYHEYSGYTKFTETSEYIGYYILQSETYTKVTKDNHASLSIEPGTTEAYTTGTLKQWNGSEWKDIGGELVANKVTATYVNALDITTKKLTVLASSGSDPIFKADSSQNTVEIGGFDVTTNSIDNLTVDASTGEKQFGTGVYLGSDDSQEHRLDCCASSWLDANVKQIDLPHFDVSESVDVGYIRTESTPLTFTKSIDISLPTDDEAFSFYKLKCTFSGIVTGPKGTVTCTIRTYYSNLVSGTNFNCKATFPSEYNVSSLNYTLELSAAEPTSDYFIKIVCTYNDNTSIETTTEDPITIDITKEIKSIVYFKQILPKWSITAFENFGVDASGNLFTKNIYANDGTFTGTINATTGTIGNGDNVFNISSSGISSTNFELTTNSLKLGNGIIKYDFNAGTGTVPDKYTLSLSSLDESTGLAIETSLLNNETNESEYSIHKLDMYLTPNNTSTSEFLHWDVSWKPIIKFNLDTGYNSNYDELSRYLIPINITTYFDNSTVSVSSVLNFRNSKGQAVAYKKIYCDKQIASTISRSKLWYSIKFNKSNGVLFAANAIYDNPIDHYTISNETWTKDASDGNYANAQYGNNNDDGFYMTDMDGAAAALSTSSTEVAENADSNLENDTREFYIGTIYVYLKKQTSTLYALSSILPKEDADTATTITYTLGNSNYKWYQVYSKNGVVQTSDRTEKDNITSLSSNYDKLFDNLKPVSYTFKNDENIHTGFIAQDIEEALAKSKLENKDFAGLIKANDNYSLVYTDIIALNTDQIQKLKKQIKALEKKVSELENK